MTSIKPETIRRMSEYHDELAEAERHGPERLAEAFAQAPDGLGVHEIDRGTRIVRVNDVELALLGYAREEMVGHPSLEFIVMSETAQRAISRKLADGEELKPFVRSFKRRDGTALPLVLLDRRIKGAGGEVVGLRTVLTPADRALRED